MLESSSLSPPARARLCSAPSPLLGPPRPRTRPSLSSGFRAAGHRRLRRAAALPCVRRGRVGRGALLRFEAMLATKEAPGVHGVLQLFWFPLRTVMAFVFGRWAWSALRVSSRCSFSAAHVVRWGLRAPLGKSAQRTHLTTLCVSLLRLSSARGSGFCPARRAPPRPALPLGSPAPATRRSTETQAGLSSTRLWKQKSTTACVRTFA